MGKISGLFSVKQEIFYLTPFKTDLHSFKIKAEGTLTSNLQYGVVRHSVCHINDVLYVYIHGC